MRAVLLLFEKRSKIYSFFLNFFKIDIDKYTFNVYTVSKGE